MGVVFGGGACAPVSTGGIAAAGSPISVCLAGCALTVASPPFAFPSPRGAAAGPTAELPPPIDEEPGLAGARDPIPDGLGALSTADASNGGGGGAEPG